MKKYLVYLLIFFSVEPIFASVHGVEKHLFKCSNGSDYDVGIYISGGWGPFTYKFSMFCSTNTLKEEFYGWQLPSKDSNPEMAACIDDAKEDVNFCAEEYQRLNSIEGDGEIPSINHGR